jgi:hypothetical protein
MVEDKNVESSMVLFGHSLQAFRDVGEISKCAAQRQFISLTLSHCVHKSLGKNWGFYLGVDDRDQCTESLSNLAKVCPDPNADKAPPDTKQPTTRAN